MNNLHPFTLLFYFSFLTHLTAAEKVPTPVHAVGAWAEWSIELAPPKPRQTKGTDETREQLLDTLPPKAFRIRLTVLANEFENYQIRMHLLFQGRTEVQVFSASPKALLASLPLYHGAQKLISQEEAPVPPMNIPGLLSIIEVTPEGGTPYQIKRWTLSDLTLGPARLEFPKGRVRLIAYGRQTAPSFPVPETTVAEPKKPAEKQENP